MNSKQWRRKLRSRIRFTTVKLRIASDKSAIDREFAYVAKLYNQARELISAADRIAGRLTADVGNVPTMGRQVRMWQELLQLSLHHKDLTPQSVRELRAGYPDYVRSIMSPPIKRDDEESE